VQGPGTDTVCVLAVPGDMGIAEFCQFLGSYMPLIPIMRMVRREDVPRSTCMSVIQFKDHQAAQRFVEEYNGKPFSLLEPEIICRAVFTTGTEMHVVDEESLRSSPSPVTGSAPNLEAPKGFVELPTCPVCLERLDEHISGVVTTVCMDLKV
jgi:BRCA1-associated protein